MRFLTLLKKITRFLAGLIVLVYMVAVPAAYAVDQNPPGFFELDGNTHDEPDPDNDPADDPPVLNYEEGDDWDTPPDQGGATAFTGIISDPAPKTIYWKGGSKDINDVTEWWWKDGSVPDKDDITNAYAAAYVVDADVGTGAIHKKGDLIIYFGLDRYANEGDAFAGFWFFQENVFIDYEGTNENVQPNRFSGKHLPGDVLVLVEYPQGSGSEPEIKIYAWDPVDSEGNNVAENLELLAVVGGDNAKCHPGEDLGMSTGACAITNDQQLFDEPMPDNWEYTAKDGSQGIPPESFFEGGINLSYIFRISNMGAVPCISSFLAETRSSRSETAQLKDFVGGSFPVCGISATKQCLTATLDDTKGEITVSFSGTVVNDGVGSFVALLEEKTVGAEITALCIEDDEYVNGLCGDATDTVITPDETLPASTATFDLLPGETVVYEAQRVVTKTGSYSNKVIAYAYLNDADVGIPDKEVAKSELIESNTCTFDVNPALKVVKNCIDMSFDPETNMFTVDISGYVENSGDIKLVNVALDDDTFGDLDISVGELTKGQKYDFSKSFTVSKDATHLSREVNTGSATYSHNNTITASGETELVDSSGETIKPESVSDDVDGDCSVTITPALTVTKACTPRLEIKDGYVVVAVDVEATVTNTGGEDLTITSLDDVPYVDFSPLYGSLLYGESKSFNGTYYPSAVENEGGEDISNLDEIWAAYAWFSDTVTVEADGDVSSASATAEYDVNCKLCFEPAPE